jgi:hypothetical protein
MLMGYFKYNFIVETEMYRDFVKVHVLFLDIYVVNCIVTIFHKTSKIPLNILLSEKFPGCFPALRKSIEVWSHLVVLCLTISALEQLVNFGMTTWELNVK